jgi:hypothetical protein
MTEKLRLQLCTVASVEDAFRLSRGVGGGLLDGFPVQLVICPANPDGTVPMQIEVTVSNDWVQTHFHIAHLAGMFLLLVNETKGLKVPLVDKPIQS